MLLQREIKVDFLLIVATRRAVSIFESPWKQNTDTARRVGGD